MSKYGHREHNWFEAIVNKMGGEECAEQFLRGELTVQKPAARWCIHGGIAYFTVAINEVVGKNWGMRLRAKGRQIRQDAEMLMSEQTAVGKKVLEVAVLPVRFLEFGLRSVPVILAEAERRGLTQTSTPRALACHIREMFSDEDVSAMGFAAIIVIEKIRMEGTILSNSKKLFRSWGVGGSADDSLTTVTVEDGTNFYQRVGVAFMSEQKHNC